MLEIFIVIIVLVVIGIFYKIIETQFGLPSFIIWIIRAIIIIGVIFWLITKFGKYLS